MRGAWRSLYYLTNGNHIDGGALYETRDRRGTHGAVIVDDRQTSNIHQTQCALFAADERLVDVCVRVTDRRWRKVLVAQL